MNVFLDYERAGAELNEILFDNNKVGGVAASRRMSSTVNVEEGVWVDVSFSLGMVTPRKTHTLIISSPDSTVDGDGRHAIGGIRIIGVPSSARR